MNRLQISGQLVDAAREFFEDGLAVLVGLADGGQVLFGVHDDLRRVVQDQRVLVFPVVERRLDQVQLVYFVLEERSGGQTLATSMSAAAVS